MTSIISNSTSIPTTYEVFLSFSGKDTRTCFTSHLYNALCRNGIRTFMDDPELRSGEVISSRLIEAIHGSKINIVVLSENYASSSWCLDELVEILKCFKELGRLVIPIFYKIDPSVVRYQIGSYETAFEKHRIRFASEMEKVNNWCATLREVANFSGYHISDSRDQAEKLFVTVKELAKTSTSNTVTLGDQMDRLLVAIQETEKSADNCIDKVSEQVEKLHAALTVMGIGHQECQNRHTRTEADINNEVVDRILLEIKPTTLEVATYPVGLDSRIKHITSLLNISGLTIIGIYGMGGIGKTTLAKAVFNQISLNFGGSSFLADVRGVSGAVNGLVSLQQQLIDEVLKKRIYTVHNVSQGIESIKQRISSIKVLIVLDDLDNPDQFESLVGSFAFGSVIMITTRNEDLLLSIGVEPRYRYMLEELGKAESRQLFNQHAFRDKIPSATFMDLSREILRHAAGLPLALKIFGSNLRNQSVAEWKRFVGQLQDVPNPDILKKLVISFDALLDPMLKEMFLDIACFFVGKFRDNVVHILGSCYRDVEPNIDRLKSRCLITFDENNCFSMHDLLRDMGWEIARQNSPKDEPEKHSRLCDWEDICDVLGNNKGTTAIRGMVPHYSFYNDEYYKVTFDTESFKKMPKLRFLKIKHVNLAGSFEQTFNDLRWLQWLHCPLKTLPSDFWPKKLVILELSQSKIRMWEPVKDFKNLKILDLSKSDELITTPDFSRLPFLEIINLKWCTKLKKVDTTIGILVNLVSLDLENCTSLRSLPDSVCNLRALESLNIGDCCSLYALPEQLGNIESLIKLKLRRLDISKLPDSLGSLIKLVKLRLDDNKKLETLPHTIRNMTSLEILDIDGCNKLDISHIQLPPNLKQLWARECRSMLRLPDVSYLKHLEILFLRNCTNLREIQGLDTLISVKSLFLQGCYSLVLTNTLTKRFFQRYSEFENEIRIDIETKDTPEWIVHSSSGSAEVRINVPQTFLGLLLSLECPAGRDYNNDYTYTVKNRASGLTYSNSDFYFHRIERLMTILVIVPIKCLIESCGGVNENTVFDVTASCRHEGEKFYLGVHPLYQPWRRWKRLQGNRLNTH